jgi:hypothetical protein
MKLTSYWFSLSRLSRSSFSSTRGNPAGQCWNAYRDLGDKIVEDTGSLRGTKQSHKESFLKLVWSCYLQGRIFSGLWFYFCDQHFVFAQCDGNKKITRNIFFGIRDPSLKGERMKIISDFTAWKFKT